MGVLAEYVKKEADQLRAEWAKQRENLDEWLAAVSALYDQLERWVREADGGLGLLGVARDKTKVTISEPRLGNYECFGMWVVLGAAGGAGRQAWIAPKARYGSAMIQPTGHERRRADGRVEIASAGGMTEFYLFRLRHPDGNRWYIRSYALWHADMLSSEVEELTAERFEAALLRVLQ